MSSKKKYQYQIDSFKGMSRKESDRIRKMHIWGDADIDPSITVDPFIGASWLIVNDNRGGYNLTMRNDHGELIYKEALTKEQVIEYLLENLYTGKGVRPNLAVPPQKENKHFKEVWARWREKNNREPFQDE